MRIAMMPHDPHGNLRIQGFLVFATCCGMKNSKQRSQKEGHPIQRIRRRQGTTSQDQKLTDRQHPPLAPQAISFQSNLHSHHCITSSLVPQPPLEGCRSAGGSGKEKGSYLRLAHRGEPPQYTYDQIADQEGRDSYQKKVFGCVVGHS
jgi:hypothetical protein